MEDTDIDQTIERLRARATRAERKSLIFMIILGLISAAAVSLILYLLFQNRGNNGPGTDAYVEYFFGQMMKAEFSPSDVVEVTERLAQLVQTDYTSLIVNVIFSLGTVGFTVLLIQIMGNFIRYYARLAELYNSQADALELSKNDVEHAAQYAQILSPIGVDFGKTPISVYEKALDAVSDLAKSSR